MADLVKSKVKERSMSTERYKYGKVKSYLEKVVDKSNECAVVISTAKYTSIE